MALSGTGQRLLELVPPYLAKSTDAQQVIDVLARECDRVEAASGVLVANYFPQQGNEYLKVWEALLGLSIEPPDKTLAQRQTTVLAYLQSLKSSGSGLDWEANLTRLIGTGWSYTEDYAPWTLRITIPFGSVIATPAAPTATPATTGGTLPAGGHRYVVTAINSYGETTASPNTLATTTGATGRVSLSWTAITGATGYRIYRAATNAGAGGPYMLLTTVLGQATTTYSDTGLATSASQPPTVNSTSSPQAYEAEALARVITPAHLDLVFGYGVGFIVGVSQVGEEPI